MSSCNEQPHISHCHRHWQCYSIHRIWMRHRQTDSALQSKELEKKWRKVREMRMHWFLTRSEWWWTLRVKYGDRWLPQRGLNRGSVQIRVVEGCSKGRKGVTAREQGWAETGNICAWNWRPGPVGRWDRSYGGQPWWGAFMQGAVFGVVKVVGRERYKLLFVLHCVFIAVIKRVDRWFWVINVVWVQIKQRVGIFITVFVRIALIFEVSHSNVSLHVNIFVWCYVALSECVNVSWWFRVSEQLQGISCVSGITVEWIIISDWIYFIVIHRTKVGFCAVRIMPTDV